MSDTPQEWVNDAAEYLAKRLGVKAARAKARWFAEQPETVRGPEFWRAVVSRLDTDSSAWRGVSQ